MAYHSLEDLWHMPQGKLAKLAFELQYDRLTGLLRRDPAQDMIERRLAQGGQVLLVVDIDHFKSINDTYGHNIGDFVLAAVASALKGAVRKGDVVSRYGGEEFVLCCKHAAQSEPVAERLRRAIAELNEQGLSPVPVTVSIGVADPARHLEHNFASLFRRADAALYEAKRAGRNCCREAA